jgi:hypothetical protein
MGWRSAARLGNTCRASCKCWTVQN